MADLTVTVGVYSIARIKQEAQEAAQKYSDVNFACPYPFYSTAGHVFKEAFAEARAEILARQQSGTSA